MVSGNGNHQGCCATQALVGRLINFLRTSFRMQPVVSHENSLEVSAPGPPIAVEMGALQPQDPSGPLEQNESGSHTQTNPQKASIGNPNVGGPSQSRSPDFSSSLPSEPVEQKLSVSARQSQDNLQGKGEIDTSRQFISPSEAEGSLSGSHEVATTNDAALLAVKIILLLPTGARHTLHVNDTYLRERKISVEARDPFLISVYTLKELILRDWQQGTPFPCNLD